MSNYIHTKVVFVRERTNFNVLKITKAYDERVKERDIFSEEIAIMFGILDYTPETTAYLTDAYVDENNNLIFEMESNYMIPYNLLDRIQEKTGMKYFLLAESAFENVFVNTDFTRKIIPERFVVYGDIEDYYSDEFLRSYYQKEVNIPDEILDLVFKTIDESEIKAFAKRELELDGFVKYIHAANQEHPKNYLICYSKKEINNEVNWNELLKRADGRRTYVIYTSEHYVHYFNSEEELIEEFVKVKDYLTNVEAIMEFVSGLKFLSLHEFKFEGDIKRELEIQAKVSSIENNAKKLNEFLLDLNTCAFTDFLVRNILSNAKELEKLYFNKSEDDENIHVVVKYSGDENAIYSKNQILRIFNNQEDAKSYANKIICEHKKNAKRNKSFKFISDEDLGFSYYDDFGNETFFSLEIVIYK